MQDSVLSPFHLEMIGLLHPQRIEKFLMQALPFKDFADLGLARYYPRIYRGLPRLYHKDSPLQSRVEQNYSHLPSLKKWAVAKALYSLYSKVAMEGTVAIASASEEISQDLFHMLRARFPKVELLQSVDPALKSEILLSCDQTISLGLHFLEKGILIRRPCRAFWDDLKNESLQKMRIVKNRFYLAFLSTPIGGAIYLHSLLKSLEEDGEGIDICISEVGWLIEFVERQMRAGKSVLEWDLGVKCIELHHEGKIYSIPVTPQGKVVRFLAPGPIAQSDFRVLLSLSGDFVAVNSDWSFSEAVSQNKSYFYDGKSQNLMRDVAALAENRIEPFKGALTCIRATNQSARYGAPVQEGSWVDETFFQELEEWPSIALSIGLSLQDTETLLGYKALNKIISEEFSANAFVCHSVQRALCHMKNPIVEQVEYQSLQSFASGNLSFSELISAVKNALSS